MQDVPKRPEDLVVELERLRAERDLLRRALEGDGRALRATADSLPQIVWTTDGEGAFDYGNRHWHEYVGIRLEETRRDGWRSIVHPDDWVACSERWKSAVAAGMPFEAAMRLRGTDGVFRWHLCRALPMRDGDHRIVGWVGTSTDIDDYKKAEAHLQVANHALESQRQILEQLTAQLRSRNEAIELEVAQRTVELERATQEILRSELMLAEAQQIAHLGNWEWEIASNQVVWSDELYRITGLSRQSVAPSLEVFISAFHPDDRDRFRDALVRAIQDHVPFSYEGRVRRPDGSERIIYGQAKLLLDEVGKPHRMVGTAQDVTERKVAERTLQESEERFRRFFNASFEGLVITEGNLILDLNEAFSRMFGYEPSELIGQSIFELYAPEAHPEVRQREQAEIEEDYEAIGVRKDGGQFPVEVHSKSLPMKGASARVSALRDITERRAIERMKEEFVSMVSHELRTPLTSLRGSLGLVANGLLGPIPDKAQDLLAVAVRSTERLVRLINDILDIDRLQSGKVRLELAPCDGQALVKQAVEAMSSMAESAGVAIEVSGDSAPLKADADRIMQVLVNLISNAIKFSAPGTQISIQLQVHGETLLFRISDQGRGIPHDKLETIFERFMQVDASDSRAKGGTGLGLAICRSIIQQHGGRIWAESVPGKGSTFSFFLPVFKGDRTAPAHDSSGPLAVG